MLGNTCETGKPYNHTGIENHVPNKRFVVHCRISYILRITFQGSITFLRFVKIILLLRENKLLFSFFLSGLQFSIL